MELRRHHLVMSTHQLCLLMEFLNEIIEDEGTPHIERAEAAELFNQANRLLMYPEEPRRV